MTPHSSSTGFVTLVLTACAGTVGVLCLPPLVDRFGARRSLLAALAALVIAFGASAVAPSVLWLTAAQALAGLVAGLALPVIFAFAALIAPSGQEGRILDRVLVGWTLSLVASVALTSITLLRRPG